MGFLQRGSASKARAHACPGTSAIGRLGCRREDMANAFKAFEK
jgi:hypothetical protein